MTSPTSRYVRKPAKICVLILLTLFIFASVASALFDVRKMVRNLSDSGSNYERTFSFEDGRANRHQISLSVPRSVVEETQKRYGLSRKALFQELQEDADRFARQSRGSLRIKVLPDLGYQISYSSGSEHLVKDFSKEFEERKKRHFKEHFLLLEKQTLRPDYVALQHWQTPYLTDLYRVLEREARESRMNEREFVTLLARFVQHMKYKIPPDKVDGVETLGLWPPVICLKEQAGDCDSKSTLFASLFTHYQHDASVLIITSRHTFIGIKNQHRLFPRDRTCRIGGREYLLVEMTNPWEMGKIDPKQMKFLTSGKFSYLEFH